eukprot:TRINITY_DN1070_c1_g1_i1.p1 TRINITY_DN1070_c1_g1~~TRINITY_DN1070_c1_g1_i1.p1  ORF type:complete len:134 (-),score=30.17 TRINITY_DN1070_c1_g1_i1:36-437(-)
MTKEDILREIARNEVGKNGTGSTSNTAENGQDKNDAENRNKKEDNNGDGGGSTTGTAQHHFGNNNQYVDIFADEQQDEELMVSPKKCSICLEQYRENDVIRTLPCLHQFHLTCVDQWLLVQANCPICKFEWGV